MTVMKWLVNLSIALLMITVPAVASGGPSGDPASPLRLDGEVVHATVERERQSQVALLKVKLKFTNTGERPVILLLGAYGAKGEKKCWVLTTSASETFTEALDGKPFYSGSTGPANSKSFPFWKELRRQLNSAQPPSPVTQTIKPLETFSKEIETVVVIQDDERILPGSRLWLRVLVELWPDNIEPAGSNTDNKPYGESLRRKWQASGDLQLEPILSSPIPFDLPRQDQGIDQVSEAQKKEFIDLLKALPTKGEFYSDEAVTKAGPYLPILFALTEKDIAEYDIYPFLAISRGLGDRSEHRAYAVRNFATIRHPILKLSWAAMLFASDAASPEIKQFLRDALASKEDAKMLAEMLGPGFDAFQKRLRAK